MNEFNGMPYPPGYGYNQYAYDNFGNPIQAQTYPPQQSQYYQQQAQQAVVGGNGLGLNMGSLINTNVSVPINSDLPDNGAVVKKSRKKKTSDKKSDSTEIEVVDPKQEIMQEVEGVRYEDTYAMTNAILQGSINQLDTLAAELKTDLDKIRSSNTMKGKYHYTSAMATAIGTIINSKVSAVREMNSSIKAANEAEYRRYKDNRATMGNESTPQKVMDLYNAYISIPTGGYKNLPAYTQPTTLDITSGAGIVRVDTATPASRDAGFSGFMSSLTPEQNYMINEGNPDIEEVIVYDNATGKKFFQWVNTSTGQDVPNMPATDPMFLEDYTIDPRTRTAKNVNLNTMKKVIYRNEGFGGF